MSGIAFINMPFAPPDRPSIAIGILQALLSSIGRNSLAFYFNLDFYEHIDIGLVKKITGGESKPQDLVGERVFVGSLSSRADASPVDLRSEFPVLSGLRGEDASFSEALRHAQDCAPDFIDKCAAQVLRYEPQLVCFTTVFQQNIASLALAKRLKHLDSRIKVLFGGANCHGISGSALLKNYKFIDAVCTGEAEGGFIQMVESLIEERSVAHPNYQVRQEESVISNEVSSELARSFVDLNQVPTPSYDDFFERWKTFKKAQQFDAPSILFETSRGCWWGQKAHCTFCGLNGTGMAFRQKTAQRALSEMEELLNRHGHVTRNLYAVDNILPKSYEKDVIPHIRSRIGKANLFYEVKANLSRETIKSFAQNGLRDIQPGIESLSSRTLKLMRKGVSAISNVQLLKCCRQHNVTPHWNFLTGIPGETADDYSFALNVINKITHLKPCPPGLGKIRFDRYSPYFDQPDNFALVNMRPYESYRDVYSPLSWGEICKIAYFFEAEYVRDPRLDGLFEQLERDIQLWNQRHAHSLLCHFGPGDVKVFLDLRSASSVMYQVSKLQAEIIGLTEGVSGREAVRERIGGSLEKFEAELSELVAAGLVAEEGNLLLSLSNEWDESFQMTDLQKEGVQRLISEMKRNSRGTSSGIDVPILKEVLEEEMV